MLEALMRLAAENQMATGMVAAALTGVFAYTIREFPGQLWRGLRELLTVSVSIEGTDPLFEHLSVWFSRNGAATRSPRLMAQREFDYELDDFRWTLTIGRGHHLLWFEGWPLVVRREINEGGDALQKLLGGGLSQTLHLMMPGRNQARIRRILAQAERIYKDDGKVRVFYWCDSYFALADRRDPRPISTVFLPAAQKERLVADVLAFAEAKPTYRQRGTPYRRGYMFEGHPGTGKTSLIFVLAGLLGRAVFVVNLASVTSDNALMTAFNLVGPDGALVIEDIDAAEISHDRARSQEAPTLTAPGAPAPPVKQGITLSGLLNAMDGVAAREGRITFVTTNHPEKLDAALLRSGRIDVRERIEPLDAETAWEMYRAFRPNAGRGEFLAEVAGLLPLPAAELQNILQGGPRWAEARAGESARAAATPTALHLV